MNVLVYNGPGASSNSVKQTLTSLRSLVSDHYDVLAVDHSALSKGHWIDSTAMLVIPGCRFTPYYEYLDRKGMERITQFVLNGGKYFGICAGAYFAADKVSFSPFSNALYPSLKNNLGLSNISGNHAFGAHLLKLFSGLAKGSIVPLDSDDRSMMINLSLNNSEMSDLHHTDHLIPLYSNGAPWFEQVQSDKNEKVLAFYETPLNGRKPAIIQCTAGKSLWPAYRIRSAFDKIG